MNRALRLLLSAVVLVVCNKAGIAIGFLAYHYSGNPNQLLIQVPVAVTVSIASTMLWLLRCGRLHRLDLENDSIYVFLLVFPVGALLFIPVHYLFTGYLTGFGNIIGGWVFAFLANVPAFAISASIWRRRAAGACN